MLDPRLAQAIAETFQVPSAGITEASSPQSIPAWDSLGHLNLVAALEKAFAVSLTMDEILAMQDAGAIARILAARST